MSKKRESDQITPSENETDISMESKINTMYLDRFIQATVVSPKLIQMHMLLLRMSFEM